MIDPLALHRGRPLRVLHGCYEIAGQGMALAAGLRALGCEARSLAYRVDWDGRRPDFVVELDRLPGDLVRGGAMMASLARWAPAFDIFHFHFGTSFLPRQLDLPLLRSLGKKIVFHFHGCEVRNREHMRSTHTLAACTECIPFCRPSHQRWLLQRAARYADHVFYSTLDLAESVPGASYLPLAIETAPWHEAARRATLEAPELRDGVNGPVVVAHAPTNRWIKGTGHVEAAIETLKREFPLLELRLIERQPWARMPSLLGDCDLLVDQLMMGWYGLLAIEGMAESKPVVCYLRDDFRGGFPDCPVVSATPTTLAETLRDLVRDPARRREIGGRGAPYVNAHHEAAGVARGLLAVYQECLAPEQAKRQALP